MSESNGHSSHRRCLEKGGFRRAHGKHTADSKPGCPTLPVGTSNGSIERRGSPVAMRIRLPRARR